MRICITRPPGIEKIRLREMWRCRCLEDWSCTKMARDKGQAQKYLLHNFGSKYELLCHNIPYWLVFTKTEGPKFKASLCNIMIPICKKSKSANKPNQYRGVVVGC